MHPNHVRRLPIESILSGVFAVAGLVTGIAMLSASPDSACASGESLAGGMIHFTGAIVAPSFAVGVSRAGTGAQADGFATEADARQTTVSFVRQSADAAQAAVALMTTRGAPQREVAGRFVDGAGHAVAADHSGTYHVGAMGGVLSLDAQRGTDAARGVPVMVVVSYS